MHASQTVLPEMFLVCPGCPVIYHAVIRDALGEIQAMPAFTWCLISKFIFSGQWLEHGNSSKDTLLPSQVCCLYFRTLADRALSSCTFCFLSWGRVMVYCEVFLFPSSSRLPVRRILKQDSNETLCSEQPLIRIEEG